MTATVSALGATPAVSFTDNPTGTATESVGYIDVGQMFQYMDIVATEPGTNVVFRRCSMARVRK